VDTVLPEAVEPGSIAPLGSDALLFASPTTRDHIGRVVVESGPIRVLGCDLSPGGMDVSVVRWALRTKSVRCN
jgi:hypothetical protein